MRLFSILFILCISQQAVKTLAAVDSLPFTVPPENIVVFTPDDLFRVIEERNTRVKYERSALSEAEAAVGVAYDAWLPDLSVSWQGGYLGNGYLTDRDFSGGMGICNPHFVNNFAFEAMQTVYEGGAISQGIKLAELNHKMSLLSLDGSRLQMRFLALSWLIDLHDFIRRKSVMDSNIELARQVLETMRIRFDEGVVLKSDIARYELQVSYLELQRDKLNECIVTVNSRIATALDYPDGTLFSLKADSIDENFQIDDIEVWQQMGRQENIGIKQANVAKEMSMTSLKIANAERMPHIGAFIYGRFNSPITIEVPVLNKNFMYWGFGINVSYSLSSLFKTSKKLKKAHIAVMESELKVDLAKEGVSDEIVTAYQAFMTARSELRTQRANLRLAQENYEIVSDRFNEGMALVTDLVDAANLRIAAQTGVENSRNRLLFCLYRLKFITNTL